jgi:hypothetical protein
MQTHQPALNDSWRVYNGLAGGQGIMLDFWVEAIDGVVLQMQEQRHLRDSRKGQPARNVVAEREQRQPCQ